MAYTYKIQSKAKSEDLAHSIELVPVRVVDSGTHIEHLEVEIKVDKNSVGKVECRFLSLEKDLQQLREYGTGFLRPDIMNVKKAIDDNYWDIETREEKNINPLDNNKVFQAILDMYSEYITNMGDAKNFETIKTTQVYNMPVDDFSDYFDSSDYASNDIKYFRQKLKNEKYISYNTGRTDRTVRLPLTEKKDKPDEQSSKTNEKKNKPAKCISFYVEETEGTVKIIQAGNN